MKKKKIFQRISIFMAIALLLAGLLCGCGDEGSEANDPNLGFWEATTASMSGLTMEVSDLFEGGVQLNLKANGKALLYVEGEEYRVRWTLEDGVLQIGDHSLTMMGTIEGNVLTLENLMGSGVSLTFEK